MFRAAHRCRAWRRTHLSHFSRGNTEQRLLSTSTDSGQYPFPDSPNPLPHEIFHLPRSASPADVKSRYYELVRLYHPDSLEFRKRQPDHALRHAQFRAITAAYDKLQRGAEDAPTTSERRKSEQEALRRARQRRAYREPVISDERWKDRLIIGSACLALAVVVYKYVTVRQEKMRDAVNNVKDWRTQHRLRKREDE